MVVRRTRLFLCALAFAAAFVLPVSADHAWGTYHWFRTENPVTLEVGDNLSGEWYQTFVRSLLDWNQSEVLDLVWAPGATTPRRCRPTAGRIEVCNEAYGATGWLGVAQIWVSGNHITQATTKLNDTYFNQGVYDSDEWRQFVMCQEIGHAFGLDHQDEDFDNPNLGSCMDYTNDPNGPPSNERPNVHDYDQLAGIYAHTDAASGGGGGGGGRGRGAAPQLPPAVSGFVPGDSMRDWGELVRNNRRGGMFHLDLGNGQRVFTFVIWA